MRKCLTVLLTALLFFSELGPAAADAKKVEQLDATIGALAAAPDTVGRLGQIRAFATALRFLAQREELAKAVPDTKGPPVDTKKLQTKIDAVLPKLRVVVNTDDADKILVSSLETGLKTLGYKPTVPYRGKAEVWVKATSAVENTDGPRDDLIYVLATVEIEVIDGLKNKPIGKFKEGYRYGSKGYDDKDQNALQNLADRVQEKAAKRIDDLIRGNPL